MVEQLDGLNCILIERKELAINGDHYGMLEI